MAGDQNGRRKTPRGFLAALRRDVRGNTLAMMAIALIPLCAMAGSAVDTARMYVVKSRLQQACDAGVLAGRKFMTSSDDSTLDPTAQQRARDFFDNNFDKDWMTVKDVQFNPTKTADQQVAGEARATVPMSVMKMFKMDDVQLTVKCEARFDVADADIMMVLDTTGSMACAASDSSCSTGTSTYTREDGTTGYYVNEKSNSKLSALRRAMLDFWDTIDVNKDPTTNVRYGFVPYTSTVNVGYQIPQSFLINGQYNYQSRRPIGDSNMSGNGNKGTTNYGQIGNAACNAKVGRSPETGFDPSNGTAIVYTRNNNGNGAACVIEWQRVQPLWRYASWPADVSQYVTGAEVQDPSEVVTRKARWQGCIEERDTTAGTSFDPNNLPPDLDPDLAPANDDTKWRPMWPTQIWRRSSSNNNQTDTANDLTEVNTLAPNGYVSCGKSAQRLQETSRSQMQTYVNSNDFRPLGGTYHDVGMIWGTRFLSPSGPFANDTAAWPGRNEPNRHIVFMTDGDMAPNEQIYGLYGLEYHDKRVSGGNFSSLTARHNARFIAECQAARNRNITVWVVAFGSGLNDQLKACATPPWNQHAFFAANDQQLRDAFKQIAAQVAMLRVSK